MRPSRHFTVIYQPLALEDLEAVEGNAGNEEGKTPNAQRPTSNVQRSTSNSEKVDGSLTWGAGLLQ